MLLALPLQTTVSDSDDTEFFYGSNHECRVMMLKLKEWIKEIKDIMCIKLRTAPFSMMSDVTNHQRPDYYLRVKISPKYHNITKMDFPFPMLLIKVETTITPKLDVIATL